MELQLRRQLLKAAVRDRAFLKSSAVHLHSDDFPNDEERIIADVALKFYDAYKEPISSLLRHDALELASKERLGAEVQQRLRKLIDDIQSGKLEMVPVKALEERVHSLRTSVFYENAVQEILSSQERGELTADTLQNLVHRANVELARNGHAAVDYFADLDKRIERRRKMAEKRPPLFMIRQLDRKIRGLERGRLGVVLAPPGGGKGLFMVHMGAAYAMQGYNVTILTMEDPITLYEDRLDASISGLPLNKLYIFPKTLRKRLQVRRAELKDKIRIIEGLDSEWTVRKIEELFEYEKKNGFVADVLLLDYDEFIVSDRRFNGDAGPRLEIQHVYSQLKSLAAKLDVIVWTAAQPRREAEDKAIIAGRDAAESYAKIRRAFIALGIGKPKQNSEEDQRLRFIHVIKHRTDRARFMVSVISDFESGLLYDAEATDEYEKLKRKKVAEGKK